MTSRSLDPIVQRVRGEYLEMPGLSLTERQAQRLWHLEPEACHVLLKALVESGFLRQTSRGGYVRAKVT
jgi:DNA-binding IclR family transcriptional regulator